LSLSTLREAATVHISARKDISQKRLDRPDMHDARALTRAAIAARHRTESWTCEPHPARRLGTKSALAARHVPGSAYGARMGAQLSSRWTFARHHRGAARHPLHRAARHVRWTRQRHARHAFALHWRRHALVRRAARLPRVQASQTPVAFTPGRPLELHPLLAVARRDVGGGRVSRQGGPWRRDFVNKVAAQAGYRLANHSRCASAIASRARARATSW
jgi:hypothetical protein